MPLDDAFRWNARYQQNERCASIGGPRAFLVENVKHLPGCGIELDVAMGLGGEIVTNRMVTSMDDLPAAKAVFFDLAPKGVLQIAGDRRPKRYRRQLERYRYGPGVCKVDWALDGPIPWRAPEVASAATVHLGGTLEEIATSEREVWRGGHIKYNRDFSRFMLRGLQKVRTELGLLAEDKNLSWS